MIYIISEIQFELVDKMQLHSFKFMWMDLFSDVRRSKLKSLLVLFVLTRDKGVNSLQCSCSNKWLCALDITTLNTFIFLLIHTSKCFLLRFQI